MCSARTHRKESKMPEDFTFYKSETVHTYAEEHGRWVYFWRDKKDINGRESHTLFAELRKDRVAEFIEWLRDLHQE